MRLRRQIPYTHAAEILLTGKHLTAREARFPVAVRARMRCVPGSGAASTRAKSHHNANGAANRPAI